MNPWATAHNAMTPAAGEQIYSFRAECLQDVRSLLELLPAVRATTVVSHPEDLPDVAVEMCAALSIDRLRAMMRSVEDGHVMVETLAAVPLSKNELRRANEVCIGLTYEEVWKSINNAAAAVLRECMLNDAVRTPHTVEASALIEAARIK